MSNLSKDKSQSRSNDEDQKKDVGARNRSALESGTLNLVLQRERDGFNQKLPKSEAARSLTS